MHATSEFRRFNISLYDPEIIKDYDGSLSWSLNLNKVFYRFYYHEMKDGNSQLKYLNYQPSKGFFKNISDEDSLQFTKEFLKYLADHIEVNPELTRVPIGRDYLLNIYDDHVKRFNYLNQHPDDYLYTADELMLEEGYGLFASSYYYNFFAQRINQRTLDSLVFGQITKELGFIYP